MAKRVTSVGLSTDHRTLCSYVPWGRGGYPQATIARVKYSPAEHLVRSAFWKVPSALLWESRWERELKIQRYLTDNPNGLVLLQSQQTVVG